MKCVNCDSKNLIKAFNFEYYDAEEIKPFILAVCNNFEHQDYFWNRYEFFENICDFKITEIKLNYRLSTNFDYVNQLCESIKEHIHIGEFKSSNGDVSDWYIDSRPFILNKDNSILIGKIISDVLKNDIKCIGGPATSAIPIITAVINQHKNDLCGFYVRAESKSYGLIKKIEGNVLDRVAIVDDVYNTGESLLRCIKEVEHKGCIVDQVITLFDRNDSGLKIKELGYDYTYIVRVQNGEPIYETYAIGSREVQNI